HPITMLPFVEDQETAEGHHRCFWAVEGTGDYASDCGKGQRMALLAIEYIAHDSAPALLTWCVKDMISQGNFGGIEVGFLEAFGAFAGGSMVLRKAIFDAHAAREKAS